MLCLHAYVPCILHLPFCSNFGIPHLEKLFSTCTIRPAVNQIDLHPFLQWRDVVDYCKAQGIVLEVSAGFLSMRCPLVCLIIPTT